MTPGILKLRWSCRFLWLLLLVLGAGPGRPATLPAGFVEEQIGGTWNEAVGLTFAADGRMYVWERQGYVWIVENGVKSATPFLDIRSEVAGYRDFGLLGFALDPNFYNNGYVYAMYVVDRHHLMHYGSPNYVASSNQYYQATIGRITRYTARASDGFRSVDPTSPRILVGESRGAGFPILHESHGIGSLVFGTDGTLLAACGDGASYSSQDTGSAPETYWQQALNDGIIRAKENVGAYRSQLVDCLNGKIIRIDPATGNGVPSNPFYDPANPRAARSRVWALGLRNPFRMTLRPGTGSHHPGDANPGVLYIGDVGYATWEDLHVCDRPGLNFGWPAYEGLTAHSGYHAANVVNQDAPNPLFGGGCTQRYFYFRDLIKQDSLAAASWPNPCNTSQQIPPSIPRFLHARPALDWHHSQVLARTGTYSGNQAAVSNVGAAGSPVSGSMFRGNSSTGGAWYTNSAFPAPFRHTYFHADFGAHWIKSIVFTADNKPIAVQNFTSDAGGVVDVEVDHRTGELYYIAWTQFLRRIRYAPSGNQPPVAVASADRQYGPAPLRVQFSSAESRDPEGQRLSYRWTFGDGSPTSTNASPAHTFNGPAGVPTTYQVALVVTDVAGARDTNRVLISVNNTPPQVTITSPTNGTRYSVTTQTVYRCTATVNDAEHSGGQLRCVWQTILHHNDHSHAEPFDTNCTTSTTISPVGCGSETYYYRVLLTVTDAGGLATTREVRLNPACAPRPPVIVTPPQDQIADAGGPASLSVNASGEQPLGYQWWKDGFLLPGETNATLALAEVGASEAGFYLVVVSNIFGVVTSLPPASLTVRPAQTLVPAGALWKYLDDGSDQGTHWTALDFADSGWRSGPAQLGYGDGDEVTSVRSSRSNGSRIMTTYFRREFEVPQAAPYTNLLLRVLRDDGVRVYLNGVEVYRNNLPTGAVTFATQATATVGGAEEATVFMSTNVNPLRLRDGTNLLAAEIHQVTNTSSDISFDLELTGGGRPAELSPLLHASVVAGQFRIWFYGEAGRSYVVESSTNLQSWTPAATNTPVNYQVDYARPANGQRFFRVRKR